MTLGRVLVTLLLCHADIRGQNAGATGKAQQNAASQAAHAKLRAVQGQLAKVNAKMSDDFEAFEQLTADQNAEDSRWAVEHGGASSFLETSPMSLTESKAEMQAKQAARVAAHAKLAKIQKELAAVNAKMQDGLNGVLALSHEQDEQDMREAEADGERAASFDMAANGAGASSFAQTGSSFVDAVPHGMEDAAAKLHAVEEQLRRQDQQYRQEAGEIARSPVELAASFAETGKPHVDNPFRNNGANSKIQADIDRNRQEQRDMDAEFKALHKRHMERKAHEERAKEEFRKEHSGDDDEASLLQLGTKGMTGPKATAALNAAEKQERDWEKRVTAESEQKMSEFESKLKEAIEAGQ